MKNKQVESILTAVGVIFINTTEVLLTRKALDSNVIMENDKLHWRIPGSFSVPSFIFRSILHLYIRIVVYLVRLLKSLIFLMEAYH